MEETNSYYKDGATTTENTEKEDPQKCKSSNGLPTRRRKMLKSAIKKILWSPSFDSDSMDNEYRCSKREVKPNDRADTEPETIDNSLPKEEEQRGEIHVDAPATEANKIYPIEQRNIYTISEKLTVSKLIPTLKHQAVDPIIHLGPFENEKRHSEPFARDLNSQVSFQTLPSVMESIPPSHPTKTVKKIPPTPRIMILKPYSAPQVELVWKMCLDPTHESISWYEVFLYGCHGEPSLPPLWNLIGTICARHTTKTCSIMGIIPGVNYYITMRAMDKLGRHGPFCKPKHFKVSAESRQPPFLNFIKKS